MTEIDDFLRYLQADRGYSARTIATYRRSLLSLQRFFLATEASLTWETIDADIVRRWMVEAMRGSCHARTIAKDLSAVRSLYKYLLRVGRVKADPIRLLQSPKFVPALPTFLRQSEVDELFDQVTFPDTPEGLRDHTMLLTFYHTGIRVSELVGLDRNDIDLAQGELKVTGKRNKQRIVPFGPELAEALEALIQQLPAPEVPGIAQPLFRDKRGRRMTTNQVRAVVKAYLSLVTTQRKKSPHVLRHTFATAMLNNGADLEAIKELLGHESVATTEIYTHATFADLKKEYERAHPRA